LIRLSGFIDAVSIFPEVPLDTEAPSVPAGLAVSNITENSALISWDASTDNVGVVSYSILQNGSAVGSVNGNTLQYQANNLTPETAYAFTVTASDAAGNTSLPGTPVEFSTLPPPVDSIAPSVPVGLTTSNVTSSGLTLMWSASTDNVGVTNYLIYRDSLPPVSTGSNSTSYQFTELSPLTEYSFRVAASDAVGNTSQLSEPLLVTTLDESGVIAWTSNNANLPTVDWQANNMFAAGVAGIGTAPNPDFRLSVNGAIRAKEIIVETGWSDFVFEPGYYLAPLNEVESFIKLNGHLKDIPSEAHVKANGVGLAEINTLLLQKIEELTLYIIELNKRLTAIESNDK
jgi:chitodextrinase